MDLPYFDVTKQLPQDLMHVILEGIFPLHIEQLLQYVVNDLAVLSLSQINNRIKDFPYAYFNERPSPLTSFTVQGSQSGMQVFYIVIFLQHACLLFQLVRCGSW